MSERHRDMMMEAAKENMAIEPAKPWQIRRSGGAECSGVKRVNGERSTSSENLKQSKLFCVGLRLNIA
jgi:1,2-phenylacetyl-CoA epoxidase PaaB subunit